MIYYLAPGNLLENTVGKFLEAWGADLRSTLVPLAYEDVYRRKFFDPGTYIFTTLELLDPAESEMLSLIFDRMKSHPDQFCPLNDPATVMNRPRLLSRLAEESINDFRFHAIDADPAGFRYPVFIRLAHEHIPWEARLVNSAEEFVTERNKFLDGGEALQPGDLMVVEYRDTSDEDGCFRKYSVMNIGGAIVPRHVFFSSHWWIKHADLIDEDKSAEERSFVLHFRHEALIRPIFELAGIDYGRIDYAIRKGRPQVWEINTNFVILPVVETMAPERCEAQFASARKVIESISKLNRVEAAAPGVQLLKWADRERIAAAIRGAKRAQWRRKKRLRWIRSATRT